jgi:CheY-like chemotaxis protein
MTGSESDRTPGKILMVEDDPVAAHFAMHVLGKRGGFDITHTPDPAVALRLASSQTWDLVLTDAEMPGMTGLEFVAALRKLWPALPVAVITAHESADSAVRALRDQADEFLQKPVRPDQLLATATALAAKGRAARLDARQAVLAIGAHPADVEIGAAGALLVHRGLGHAVSILTLTRDSRAGTDSTRAGQAQMASLLLGATLFVEDLDDNGISEGDPTIGVIKRVAETVQPTVIYTHSLHDMHTDHRNTHRAAMAAVREVGRVYCFQSPSATIDFRPTRFVTIDEQLERKLLVINAFAARQQPRAGLEPDLIESTARHWSRFADGRHAEAFEVVRAAANIASSPAGPGQGPPAAIREGRTAVPRSGSPPATARPEPDSPREDL